MLHNCFYLYFLVKFLAKEHKEKKKTSIFFSVSQTIHLFYFWCLVKKTFTLQLSLSIVYNVTFRPLEVRLLWMWTLNKNEFISKPIITGNSKSHKSKFLIQAEEETVLLCIPTVTEQRFSGLQLPLPLRRGQAVDAQEGINAHILSGFSVARSQPPLAPQQG